MLEQFIGNRAIVRVVEETTIKTAGGNPVVTVNYAGGTTELMPKLSFEELVSTIPSDATKLRKAKLDMLAKKLLTVIAEHDLKVSEIDELNRTVGMALFESINRATNFLWTKDDSAFIPGVNCIDDRSILETELVLMDIPKKSDGNDTKKAE